MLGRMCQCKVLEATDRYVRTACLASTAVSVRVSCSYTLSLSGELPCSHCYDTLPERGVHPDTPSCSPCAHSCGHESMCAASRAGQAGPWLPTCHGFLARQRTNGNESTTRLCARTMNLEQCTPCRTIRYARMRHAPAGQAKMQLR